ncbi:hypothetical protein BWZ22_05505 [Seonamhaeicola sp. S2-3]|nr:hypothetical protein BWZ22_05505 [Seonamhaeicola sp. S2-3]
MLNGQSKPDHNTINDFTNKRLQNHLKKIFLQVVILLAEEGVLFLKDEQRTYQKTKTTLLGCRS